MGDFLEPASQPEPRQSLLRGAAGLMVAIAVVLMLLIWLPAYRWFFLISVGIGILVAGALYVWHRLRPVQEEDVEPRRPLGLD